MPICPKCKKDDQVFKVSGLYESGTSQSQISGGGLVFGDGLIPMIMGGANTSQSILAERLSPPEKLGKDRMPGKYDVRILLVIFVIMLVAFVVSTMIVFINVDAGLVISFGSLAVPIAILSVLTRENNIAREKAYRKYQKRYEDKIAAWKRQYYCARDDITFVPEEF